MKFEAEKQIRIKGTSLICILKPWLEHHWFMFEILSPSWTWASAMKLDLCNKLGLGLA